MRLSSLALLALGLPGAAQSLPATAYLEDLPLPPDSICVPMPDERDRSPDGSTAQERFEARVRQLSAALAGEIASRSRVVKEAGSRRTLSPAQEAAMGQPGIDLAEAQASQRLTPKQRHEAAMKKIEQTYGISAAEIDKLKQMKKEGNVAGVQGWGKAVTAERQAAADIDPAKTAQAQRDTLETAALAGKQAETARRIAAAVGKHTERFRELAESDDEKRLMAGIEHYLEPYKREMAADALREAQERARNPGREQSKQEMEAKESKRYGPQESCEARIARLNQGNLAQQSYCQFLTRRYVTILQDLKRTLITHQGDYAELDRIQGEVARLQFKSKPMPEQQGLSMLSAARDYSQWLAKSYLYKLTNEKQKSAANCGKLGS